MKISSHNVEFGYELIGIIPTAYYHHLQGNLEETESGQGSSPLYYFSKKHKEKKTPRSWYNTSECITEQQGLIPNISIHRYFLDLKEFAIPPYKKQYANKTYKYKKPTVCICNRYNEEWGMPPINYFSLECLSELINILEEKYQVVYFGVDLPEKLQDNAHSLKLGDYEHIKKKHKNVIIFQDIHKGSWNETMLKVFSNCEHYITMNGGYSILASYFGGKNIIYSKKGSSQTKEIDIGSFQRWYGEFGDSQIVYVDNYKSLIKKVKDLYIEEKPTINILIRTAGRERYFNECIASIEAQTYDNINIIIGIENGDNQTMQYVRNYHYRCVFYDKNNSIKQPPNNSEDYGDFFPYNNYLDKMLLRVPNGYVIYLDDDDMFIDQTAVENIVSKLKAKKDVVFWRTKLNYGRIAPSDENFGKKPVCKDITSISFCHHISNKVEWGFFKRGDYRVAKQLWLKSNNIYINEVLTAIQDTANYGQRKDKRILQKGEVVVMVLNRKMGEVGAIKYMQHEQALSLQRFKMLKIID